MKWTPEAEVALQDLKKYLSSAPMLVAPRPQEPLLLYLAATNQVVSAALVAQREEGDEAPAKATPPNEDASDGEQELPAVAEDDQEKSSPTSGPVQKKKLV